MTIVIELVKELVELFDLTPQQAMNALRKVMMDRDLNMIEAQKYIKDVLIDINYKIKK